jgi:hypothetical protein
VIGAFQYELWDRESANIVGTFDSEGDALAFVRSMVDVHGPSVTRPWTLAIEDDEGETTSLAAGTALRERALDESYMGSRPVAS